MAGKETVWFGRLPSHLALRKILEQVGIGRVEHLLTVQSSE